MKHNTKDVLTKALNIAIADEENNLSVLRLCSASDNFPHTIADIETNIRNFEFVKRNLDTLIMYKEFDTGPFVK